MFRFVHNNSAKLLILLYLRWIFQILLLHGRVGSLISLYVNKLVPISLNGLNL